MRILRNKHHRKILQQYRILYGIVPKYKVLIDGNFLNIACMCKVDLHDMLPKLLQTHLVVLFVTKCVLAELRSLGPDFDDTCQLANTMKFAKCKHKNPVSASECLQSLVGGANNKHYFVATQDAELRAHMRDIPGTPLLLFNRQVLVLDKVSRASLELASKRELKKVQPSKRERRLLQAEATAMKRKRGDAASGAGVATEEQRSEAKESVGAGDSKTVEKPVRRKPKGPKGPNPLSMKKKQRTSNAPVPQRPKKRRRKRKSKATATPSQ